MGKGIYSQTKKKEKATTTTTTQKEIKRKEKTKNCSAKTKSCYPRPRPAVESCWILGDWIDRIPNATIYSLTETAPLTEKVRSLQMLCLPENEPVWEFAMYVPLIGWGNPEDSEPCSPIIFIVFLEILIAC